LFSNTFPTGFFNSCSLVGHFATSASVLGVGGASGVGGFLVSGDLIGGGGGDFVVISNLFGS
jgi:hypothetical protein